MTKIKFYISEHHNWQHCCFDRNSELTGLLNAYFDKKLMFDRVDLGLVIFPYTYLPLVKNVAYSYGELLDLTDIDEHYKGVMFDIENNQLFLRDYQYDIVKKVTQNYRGIIQATTGFGKGEFIVYLAHTYNGKGNKLVLTNNNQVQKELKDRFKKYNVDIKEEHIKVWNPTTLMNSNKIKEQGVLNFLHDVEFIQIDEFESVTKSLKDLLRLVPNYKILYAYSASPEKVKGTDLSNPSCLLTVNADARKVMYLAGYSLYYSAPVKPVELNIIDADLPSERFPKWIESLEKKNPKSALVMKQQISQDNLFKNNLIFNILDEIVIPNAQTILFVPYRFTKHGDQFFKYYKNSKYRIVQWDGKHKRSNIPGKEKVTQSMIKQMSINNEFDILFASKVADRGVDFRNMRDIFLFVHSQFNNVTQSVGRCSRESLDLQTYVWTIRNKNKKTPFYSKITGARINRVKSAYTHSIRKWDYGDDFIEMEEPDEIIDAGKDNDFKKSESPKPVSEVKEIGGFYFG